MTTPSITSVILQHEAALSAQELDFVRYYAVEGMSAAAAGKMAGFDDAKAGRNLLERKEIRSAVTEAFAENAKRLDVGRDDVMRGLKEAIDIAKSMDDPTAMIRGWSEIGKICGYYNHEKKVAVRTDLSDPNLRLTTLSTSELERIISGQVIDAEFTEVGDA